MIGEFDSLVCCGSDWGGVCIYVPLDLCSSLGICLARTVSTSTTGSTGFSLDIDWRVAISVITGFANTVVNLKNSVVYLNLVFFTVGLLSQKPTVS